MNQKMSLMLKVKSSIHERYLQKGGEMGELIRTYDWSSTPLGQPENWSTSLLTTVSLVLNSKFPMLLWWGENLIQFYNDSYRVTLGNDGKHPMALGKFAKDCWGEVWPIIKPLIDQVRTTGDATWQEDSLIPIYRNGQIEQVYWTFSYSQVLDAEDDLGGVLVTCFESTKSIQTERKIRQSLKELAENKAKINNLIAQAPVAIGVLEGKDFIVSTVNKKILQLWGKSKTIIGMPLAKALPEIEGQNFLQILEEVYTSGKSYSSVEHLAMLEHQGVIKEFYFDLLYQRIITKHNAPASILVIATDVTAQVHARKAIEESSLQFRQLADSITQMVWITDANGLHEYYNKRWYDFTGSDLETTKGTGWSLMFHPEDRQKAWEKWNHSLKTGELYEIEYRLKNFRGEYRWVLGRAAPFVDSKGRIIKWFGTCTDINEQKLLLEQKDDFINIASHELKTPLTTFKAYMQLINRQKGNALPKSLDNLINNALKSADKIHDLVEDLLDISNMNHGGLVINPTEVAIYQIIKDVSDNLTLDGKYSVCIHGAENTKVYGDPNRLQRVIVNFITNAIKYAPDSKEITITIEEDDIHVKVAVKDKGPGICPEKIPHLFERYYRASENRHQAGLGLGLYICSEIIKKHGGKIGAESPIGVGSTFWFTVPKILVN